MIVRLFSGFDTIDIGALELRAQAVSGASQQIATSYGAYFVPFGVKGFASGTFQYSGAIQRLQDDIGETVIFFGPTDFDVRYDNAINRTVISSSRTIYSMSFNGAWQRTLGVDAEYSNFKVITGSRGPFFIFTADQERRGRDTFNYEQASQINERVSDSGIAYSVGRRDVEKRRDWEFMLEPKSNVFAHASSSTEPFGWERFIKNLRERPTPFIVMEDVTASNISYEDREALYQMRGEAMNFNPRPVSEVDNHDFWNISVRTRVFDTKHRDRKENEPGLPCSTPTAPDALYPLDNAVSVSLTGVVDSALTVALSWSQPSAVNEYNVYFGTDTTPDITELVATTTDNFYTASVTYSTDYYWRIDSINDCGLTEGVVWDFYTAVSSCILPATASNPTPSDGAVNQSVELSELSWSAASASATSASAASYNVYFDTTNPPTTQLGNTTATTWSLSSETPLLPSTDYYWRIDSQTTCGTSSSPIWTFGTEAFTGSLIATGGTIFTRSLGGELYVYHEFRGAQTSSFEILEINEPTATSVDYFVVGSGGDHAGIGQGGSFTKFGGGGAGGVVSGNLPGITASSYQVIVGGSVVGGNSGKSSHFAGVVTASGGGAGGDENIAGSTGGSGGGAGGGASATSGGLGTQGNGGGDSPAGAWAGGGGGFVTAGQPGTTSSYGRGGDGIVSSSWRGDGIYSNYAAGTSAGPFPGTSGSIPPGDGWYENEASGSHGSPYGENGTGSPGSAGQIDSFATWKSTAGIVMIRYPLTGSI